MAGCSGREDKSVSCTAAWYGATQTSFGMLAGLTRMAYCEFCSASWMHGPVQGEARWGCIVI